MNDTRGFVFLYAAVTLIDPLAKAKHHLRQNR
jgi:hypothetical protein